MTSPKKTVNRRDATGHLDPEYQRKLLDASGKSSRDDEPRAFIDGAATEELSEELGEAFVQAATTGEDAELERRESVSPEEVGGPFVPSTAGQEFAGGTDESNIPEATREALPTTSKAPV
jgi:hypothetical protein